MRTKRKIVLAIAIVALTTAAPGWWWTATSEEGQGYLEALYAIQEEEKAENALIHYILAAQKLRAYYDTVPHFDIREEPEKVVTLIETAMPIREEALRGVAVGHIRAVRFDELEKYGNVDVYAPAFNEVINVLRSQARCFEATKQFDEAMVNYVASYRMAIDLQNTPLLGSTLVERTMPRIAQEMRRLASFDEAESETLEKALSTLLEKRDSLPGYGDILEQSIRGAKYADGLHLEYYSESPKGLSDEAERRGETPLDFLRAIGRGFDEHTEFLLFCSECVKTPWWERDLMGIAEEIRIRHPQCPQDPLLASRCLLSFRFLDGDLRHLRHQSEFDATAIALALEICRRQTGSYPVDLEEAAIWMPGGLPNDPFNGEPYRYETPTLKKEYRLWSVGPDMRDDAGVKLLSKWERTDENQIQFISPDTNPKEIQRQTWLGDYRRFTLEEAEEENMSLSELYEKGDIIHHHHRTLGPEDESTFRLPYIEVNYSGGE